MIAINNSVNGKIPVKGILKRFNQMNRFNLIHQPNASPLSLGTDIHEYFNGKTGRTGHLFDNRYSRVAVESDTQAVQLHDYIHLIPVKGALDSLDAYRWSSFKAYQLGYDSFDICKHSCKSVPNECKKAPSVGEDAFGKFYMNARSLTRRVRGTCW